MVHNVPLIIAHSEHSSADDEWQAWYGRSGQPRLYSGIVSEEQTTLTSNWKDEDTLTLV